MDAKHIKFWLNEIKASEEFQKKELVERNCYPDIIEYYEGKLMYRPNVDSTQNKLDAVINEFFPNTNSLIADLMYKFPEIQVEARKQEAELTVDLMKSALEYAVKQTGALDESRLMLFDMIYAGYCACEVGHLVGEDGYEPPIQSTINEQEKEGFLDKAAGFIRKAMGTEEEVENELAPQRERNTTTERTYIRRLDPMNVLFDYRAKRVKDMRYIVKKAVMSKAEFNVTYPEFADKVHGSGKIEYSSHQGTEYNSEVVVYELQIKKKGGVYTNVCLTQSLQTEVLKEYDRPYITNGFDIKIGSFHKYGKLYPVSIARINKYINDRQNSYMRYMMEVAERTIPKIVATDDVDPKAQEALKSPKVNDVALVPRGADVTAVDFGKVSTENKELLQMFAQQKEKLWSVSESRLTGKSSSEFATEIEIQEAGFQSKQGDLQEGLRQVLVEVVEEVKDIIKQEWDGEYFFKVTGKDLPDWYQSDMRVVDGMEMNVNPLTDLLVGDYDVNLDIISSMKPNKEKKKKDLVDFITATMQFSQMTGLQINPDFIKKLATEWGYNPESVFIEPEPMPMGPEVMPQPAPTPMELAMAEQEGQDAVI